MSVDLVARVAVRLAELREHVVFVGGAIRGLLITDPAAPPERVTDDVDVIVEVATRAEYWRINERLRALGFREDTTQGAPICRWVIERIHVDVMPTSGEILGFRNRWYAAAVASSIEVVAAGERIRIVDAPHFCATKLDAFADRGGRDYLHHDIEDLIAVVDGRAELLGELQLVGRDVRRYVAFEVRELLETPAFLEAVPGHLPGDSASQARLPLILDRLRTIAALQR